jgi:hypothetical protein
VTALGEPTFDPLKREEKLQNVFGTIQEIPTSDVFRGNITTAYHNFAAKSNQCGADWSRLFVYGVARDGQNFLREDFGAGG